MSSDNPQHPLEGLESPKLRARRQARNRRRNRRQALARRKGPAQPWRFIRARRLTRLFKADVRRALKGKPTRCFVFTERFLEAWPGATPELRARIWINPYRELSADYGRRIA